MFDRIYSTIKDNEIFFIILQGIIAIAALSYVIYENADCESKGGNYVRKTFGGYVCIDKNAKEIK